MEVSVFHFLSASLSEVVADPSHGTALLKDCNIIEHFYFKVQTAIMLVSWCMAL